MPWTLAELRDASGVRSVDTIRNRLRAMGLWDFHANRGADGKWVVDDEAAQMLLSAHPVRKREVEDPLKPNGDEMARLYEKRIDELSESLRDARAERDQLRAQNDALIARVADQADAIRALPAPDAVEHARAEGEREGREAGEVEGRAEERRRIAEMGFWKRRAYLRNRV